jgi:hypothetical protein
MPAMRAGVDAVIDEGEIARFAEHLHVLITAFGTRRTDAFDASGVAD